MATYHRPNLSAADRDVLLATLKEALKSMPIDTMQFDSLYSAYLKIRDAKPIGC